MQLRCDKCKGSFKVDEKNVDKDLDFMQCPLCSAITHNPLKE